METVPLRKVSVAVLAGGKARRFGGRKIEARFQGRRLIDIACTLAREVGKDVMVMGDTGPLLRKTGFPVFPDLFRDAGPLGGIHAALSASSAEQVAAVPSDLPLMAVEVYRILARWKNREKPVVAVSHRGVEPLVSIWPVACRGILQNQLLKKHYSPLQALGRLRAIEVELTRYAVPYRREWFVNINTPGDLRLIREKYG